MKKIFSQLAEEACFIMDIKPCKEEHVFRASTDFKCNDCYFHFFKHDGGEIIA